MKHDPGLLFTDVMAQHCIYITADSTARNVANYNFPFSITPLFLENCCTPPCSAKERSTQISKRHQQYIFSLQVCGALTNLGGGTRIF